MRPTGTAALAVRPPATHSRPNGIASSGHFCRSAGNVSGTGTCDDGVVPLTRILTFAILAACAIAEAGGAAAPQQPVFRGTGDVVRVFVTVTDKDGRLVTTLKQPDFEVRDDGKPQPITVFDNSPRPIRL